MANKKPAKKVMSKKSLKGTKGGAVDAFIWFKPPGSSSPTNSLNNVAVGDVNGDINGINFHK